MSQRTVGPGEHRSDVGGHITTIEGIERAGGLAQISGENSEGEPGAGGGACSGDGQGQRKARAAGDDLVDGSWFAAYPASSQPAGQQLAGPGRSEQLELQRVRALGGDQAGQVVAAGHDGQASG
jgi:hypothetical protein